MEGEDDTISWQEFVDDPSISPNTRRIRKIVIGQLAKANGFESPTLLLDKIRLDKDKPNTDPNKLTLRWGVLIREVFCLFS